ncbi:B-cell receptor CD22-like [Anguilla anguilla]|uniref:B-cell receptor CD22-like n=1 Tax=Anguilla anguilla TaxID=7936 RepID=UPI0015AA6194|nr:B-cell receptor CD22-like [Anguilla anguilla]
MILSDAAMLFNTLLVIVLSVSGVLSQREWSVTYTPERICALKGSSEDMRCTYSYPPCHTVQKTFWFNHWNKPQEPEDLSQDPEYSDRVEYLGDKYSDCTFRINQLRKTDSKTYRFRVLIACDEYTGEPGVALEVTDLQVMVNPDTVTEGQSVTLTCSTTCTLTGSPAFIWYRDGSPLSFTGRRHQFTASSEDRSRYSCAVKGYELHSPAVALNVRYRPKSISVSVPPSGEIVEGSSVTLTCSSDGNPPVQRYTWYKNNRAELSWRGSSYTIKSITQQDAGEYYCEAGNVIGTERSPPKHLDVQYRPKRVAVSVSSSGKIVDGSSVTLTCSSNANPPVQKYTWYKNNRAELSWRGSSYTIKSITLQDAGEYYCAARNVIGTERSPPKHLDVQYRPKRVAVSVSSSGKIVDGSSVTLTCSSNANPPVQKYTWYKNNRAELSWRGSSYTIKSITLQDAGEYYCAARNVIGTERSPPKHLDVQYRPKRVSVSVSPSGEIVEGSSVTLTCSSDANPPVQRYTWFKNNGAVSSLRGSDRSYTIKSITQQDAVEYYCAAGNGIGTKTSPPKRLDVQYLQVMVNPGTVTEGQSVRLTCSTTCTLTGSPAFIWYRGGSPLSFTDQSHQFTASSEDRGRYTCAVKGYELRSPAVALNVRYPPKSVSVSVSSSGEIVEGSSVTLTCSSAANPPVQRYAWYKNNRAESSWRESSNTIKSITLQDAGEYTCQTENVIGTNISPPKRLNVQYSPKITSVSVSPSGEIVEGRSVTLTCSSDADPPVQRYTWLKKTGSVFLRRGTERSYIIKNITLQDVGEYYCEAENAIGTKRSPPKRLDVQYAPKNTSAILEQSTAILLGSEHSWSSDLYFCVRQYKSRRYDSARMDSCWNLCGFCTLYCHGVHKQEEEHQQRERRADALVL